MFTWMLASFGVGALSFAVSSFFKKKNIDSVKTKNEDSNIRITSDCFNRIYKDEAENKLKVDKDDFLVLQDGINRLNILQSSNGEDVCVSRKQHYINNSAYQCGISSGTRCPI